MPHSPLHIETKKHPSLVVKRPKLSSFDKLVLFVSVLYPFSAFPQVIAVFGGRTEGVSILSWTVFLFCASLFLAYGIKRKVAPMIISNSIWVVMDALVIVGIVIFSTSITWL